MFAVYRAFAADGSVLYVGCSDDPWARLGRHARRSDLPEAIAAVEVTYHASQEAALRVERQTIQRLRPLLNVRTLVAHNDRLSAGTLRGAVLSALSQIGRPATSTEVATLVANGNGNVSSILTRLRTEGVVRKVGEVAAGHRKGRPQFLVELVPVDSEAVA